MLAAIASNVLPCARHVKPCEAMLGWLRSTTPSKNLEGGLGPQKSSGARHHSTRSSLKPKSPNLSERPLARTIMRGPYTFVGAIQVPAFIAQCLAFFLMDATQLVTGRPSVEAIECVASPLPMLRQTDEALAQQMRRSMASTSEDQVSVVAFNMLLKAFETKPYYPEVSETLRSWAWRKAQLIELLKGLDADVVLMQVPS